MLRLALALGLGQAAFHAYIASLPLAMHAAGRPDGEIGAIMGAAAVFNIVAAFVIAGLIDRRGGRLVFVLGSVTFAVSSLLLIIGVATPDGHPAALVLVRALHGLGLAASLPAALTLVPGLVSPQRLATGLAFVGVAANVSLAITPAVSVTVLERGSLATVSVVALVASLLSIVLVLLLPASRTEPGTSETGERRPREGRLAAFRPMWRSSWAGPLAMVVLFIAHWGVVTAYLPQRAESAGADVGLFFTADAIALLALRVVGGYFSDRLGPRRLILAGLAITLVALALLLPPPTTTLLVIAGIGSGAGGALIIPPITYELSQRSTEADRGSAFSLYSVAFSVGIALGSLGIAPLIAAIGFERALMLGMLACVATGVLAVVDRSLKARPAPVATA